MALHSYSRCWVDLIRGTLNREKMLNKEAAARVSRYLHEYAETKSLYMKINYVNADRVHPLVDLPTGLPIEEMAQVRNNIIGSARSRRSFRNSFTGIGCVNQRGEAIEMAWLRVRP